MRLKMLHSLKSALFRMFHRAALKFIVPIVCTWAKKQESLILRTGVALSPDQLEDARRIGIMAPERVRLRCVDQVPPIHPVLSWIGRRVGLNSDTTAGMSLRYGLLIRSDHWGDRG